MRNLVSFNLYMLEYVCADLKTNMEQMVKRPSAQLDACTMASPPPGLVCLTFALKVEMRMAWERV